MPAARTGLTRKRSRLLHSWHWGWHWGGAGRGPECRGAASRAARSLGHGASPSTRAASRPRARPCLHRPGAGVPPRRCGRPAAVAGAAGATHPVQVEALGGLRGLLGAGAQAHGSGPASPNAARTRCHQHRLSLSVLNYQRLVTWSVATPTPVLTPLATGPPLRLQGRARLERQAVRGAPGTQIQASGPAAPRWTRTPSRRRPEMNSNDSSLMVRGPGAAGCSFGDSPPPAR